jgi:hypothetical protein
MSTGELLRVYKLLAQTGMRHLDPVFSVWIYGCKPEDAILQRCSRSYASRQQIET